MKALCVCVCAPVPVCVHLCPCVCSCAGVCAPVCAPVCVALFPYSIVFKQAAGLARIVRTDCARPLQIVATPDFVHTQSRRHVWL